MQIADWEGGGAAERRRLTVSGVAVSKQSIEITGSPPEEHQQCLENRYAPQISLSRGIVKSESTTPIAEIVLPDRRAVACWWNGRRWHLRSVNDCYANI